MLLFDILHKYVKPHEKILKRTGLILTSEIIFIFLIANDLNGLFEKDTAVIVMALIACADYFYINMRDREGMQIYFSKKSRILIAGCSAYAAFAIAGHTLFLNDEYLSLSKGISYLLSIEIIYPVIIFILYFIKKISYCRFLCELKDINVKRFRIQCFCVMFFPLLIISFGYYPGNMTTDGVAQWLGALGLVNLLDNHPAIHTLFLRLCYTVYPSVYTTVIIHIILFCLVWNVFFTTLYKKNVRKIYLLITAFLIVCSSNNYMSLLLISKNTSYTIVILWNMLLLIKMVENNNFFQNNWNTLQFILALTLLYLVRHNGFLGTYALFIVLLLWGCHYKSYLKQTILIVMGTVVIISLIRGPFYEFMGVKQVQGHTSIGPLIRPAGMYIQLNEEIPNSVNNVVDKIGTREQWEKYYNPYDGDKLAWSEIRENIVACSLDDAFRLYLTLLADNPMIVIRDRIMATDLLWNVFEPKEAYKKYGVWNGRYIVGIWASRSDIVKIYPESLLNEDYLTDERYYKPNLFSNIGKKGNSLATATQLADSLFYRNGIYVITMFILIVYNTIEKHYKRNLIIIPSFTILFTLLLADSWQIYQYYWFFSVSVCMFFLYVCFYDMEKERK